ncbi:MAG: type II toxin-antitoxin system death-on-curing family toxin [Patescibacteria group bacterium]
MKYLTAEEILMLHKNVVDETGGLHGIRDVGLLQSVVERPKTAVFGTEMFPDVWTKAASYLHSIVMNHVFVDGNKRTSVISAARFLFVNGQKLQVSNKEIEIYILRVVTEKLNIATIAQWFKMHCKETDKKRIYAPQT